MPRKTLPRIAAVSAGEKPLTLRIRWVDGEEAEVDVSGLVETFRLYEPLRRSHQLFRQVRLGEYGTDVVWPDEMDIAAVTLWRLAQEQSGTTMSPEAFRHWRERNAYTLDWPRGPSEFRVEWSPITSKGRSQFPALWRSRRGRLKSPDLRLTSSNTSTQRDRLVRSPHLQSWRGLDPQIQLRNGRAGARFTPAPSAPHRSPAGGRGRTATGCALPAACRNPYRGREARPGRGWRSPRSGRAG